MADAQEMLNNLRWNADQLVMNPFGQRVWLREAYDAHGKRIGITDCCPEETPCRWHAAIHAPPYEGAKEGR